MSLLPEVVSLPAPKPSAMLLLPEVSPSRAQVPTAALLMLPPVLALSA